MPAPINAKNPFIKLISNEYYVLMKKIYVIVINAGIVDATNDQGLKAII